MRATLFASFSTLFSRYPRRLVCHSKPILPPLSYFPPSLSFSLFFSLLFFIFLVISFFLFFLFFYPSLRVASTVFNPPCQTTRGTKAKRERKRERERGKRKKIIKKKVRQSMVETERGNVTGSAKGIFSVSFETLDVYI